MKKILVLLFAVLFALPVRAGDWSLLSRPGAMAIMRHALAPGGGDPSGFVLEDCTTQRNLDARGRAQARRTGEAMRQREIAFDAVLSSRWCRCLDTAREMAMGTAKGFPPLDSFFGDRSKGPGQTETLRAFLAAQPPDRRLLLVTHQVNITALTGIFPASGEIVVFDMAGNGKVNVLGTVLVEP